MRKILLLSDLSREPDRLLIQGLTKYGSKDGKWLIYPVSPFFREDPALTGAIVEKARNLEVDAIFGMWPVVEKGKNKLGLDIPVVLKPKNCPVTGFSSLSSDNRKVGMMAADFFRRAGLQNVTTSGMKGMLWSKERICSFKASCSGDLCPGILFDPSQVDYDKVSRWLLKLPKPVGVFACNDVNASIIIEVCQNLNLRIPEDIAVLGVDDDSFLCNVSSPTISSIRLDYEKSGYRLGQILDEKINSGDKSLFKIVHDPVCIVERESTPSISINDQYVRRIVEYMDAHFTEKIGIKEAIADIPLSRRSIEIRFKNEFGDRTMLDYLTGLRIERLKHLLESTDMTLLSAATSAGFSEIENIYRIFKKNVGCTPSEYRQVHRKSGHGTDNLA